MKNKFLKKQLYIFLIACTSIFYFENITKTFAQQNSGQPNGASVIVLPYHANDLCEAFDDMPTYKREAIDEISAGLRKQGFYGASFTAIMRNMKSKGGCDTQNPNKILRNVLRESKAQYYLVVESSLEDTRGNSYVNLNVSLYKAESSDVISYASAQSDRNTGDDKRTLVRNAWEKISSQITNEIKGQQPVTTTTTIIENPKQGGKIVANLISDVDVNIPQGRNKNPDGIAVIIGNSNYEKTKPVKFALNDALAMKKYLIETFGFQEGNIFYIEDARKSDLELMFGTKEQSRGKLFNAVKPKKSDVFIFYAGHGAPGLQDKNAYFVPVDCDPQYVEIGGYLTETFYRNLALVPAKSVSVVLDACFSGTDLFENISPIVIKAKGILNIQKGLLMASSQGAEVSSWYNEKAHGLFTYFFLKGIQSKIADKNGDNKLTALELHNFLANPTEAVPYFARKLHNIDQMPVIQGTQATKTLVEY